MIKEDIQECFSKYESVTDVYVLEDMRCAKYIHNLSHEDANQYYKINVWD